MTVTIVYATANDGYVGSLASTYAGALDGTGTKNVDTAWDRLPIGQGFEGAAPYGVTQAFLKWTYAAPAGEVVASAAIRLYHVDNNGVGVSRDVELRSYAWASPLAGTAFRSRSQLASLTLLGTLKDAQSTTGKYSMVGSTNLAALIAGGSQTLSVVAAPVRNAGGSPTGTEYTYASSADAAGTTQDPALILTSAPASTLHGVVGASVRLSDGSWMVLESDGAATPAINLRRYASGAVTTIGAVPVGSTAGTFDVPRGTQSFALVADASDNVYVVGVSGTSMTTLAVQAWVKSGSAWSVKPVVTAAAPGYNGAINNVSGAWHATGGAGVIMALVGRAAGTGNPDASTNDLTYMVLSVAVAQAGTGTLALGSGSAAGKILPLQSIATYYNSFTNETGSGLDVVSAGGTTGYVVSHGKASVPGEAYPVGLGRYEVTGTGTVTAVYRVASANYAVKDASAKVRAVGIGGTSLAVVTVDPDPGWGITIQAYQASASGFTALADPVRLDAEGIEGMPAPSALAVSSAWDVLYSSTDNKLWVYFPDATDPRIVRRTGVSLTTYVATRESVTVATVGSAGGANLAVRVQRHTAAGTSSLLTVAHRASGGALSTTYVTDTFNLPPTAPTLLPRANFDATQAATVSWIFNDPNLPNDGQSAYNLQVVDDATSVIAHEVVKFPSTAQSDVIPAGKLTNGKTYRWRVRTWDQLDQVSPYSPYSTFSTGAGGTVTITDPATDNPAGVITDDYLIKWTVTGTVQAGYRVVLVRTDTGATVSDTGWISSTATQHTVTGMVTDVQHQVRVTVRNSSLVESVTGTRYITPSYGRPEAPIVTVEAMPAGGYVLVTIQNPPPAGDRPEVVRNEVWRRPLGSTDYDLIGTVLPGDEFRDYSAASGVTYEYRVRGVSA